MSATASMQRAARTEWRRLPQMQQDAIHSSLLLPHADRPHADRPHGFDRELLHSWPSSVYAALHLRGLIDEAEWPCLLTPAGIMVLEAGIGERS